MWLNLESEAEEEEEAWAEVATVADSFTSSIGCESPSTSITTETRVPWSSFQSDAPNDKRSIVAEDGKGEDDDAEGGEDGDGDNRRVGGEPGGPGSSATATFPPSCLCETMGAANESTSISSAVLRSVLSQNVVISPLPCGNTSVETYRYEIQQSWQFSH